MSETTNVPEQEKEVILDYLKDFDKFSLGLYDKLKKDNENVIEVKENEYVVSLGDFKYSVKNIIKFPYKGNIKDLFDCEDLSSNDEIFEIKDSINIFKRRNSKVSSDRIALSDLTQIGNNKIYYIPTNKELFPDSMEEDSVDFDEIYYINFNEKTGDLVVDAHERYKDIAYKSCVGFFADFTTTKIKKHNDELFDKYVLESTVDAYKKISFKYKSKDDRIVSILNDEETSKKAYKDYIEWVKGLYSFNKRDFYKYIMESKEIVLSMDVPNNEELTKENAFSFVNKNSLYQYLYSNGIDSLINNFEGDIEKDERGVPVLTDDDVKSLMLMGMPKEGIEQTINRAKEIIDESFDNIEFAEKELNNSELKSNRFDGLCQLCTTLMDNDNIEKEFIDKISPINRYDELEKTIISDKDILNTQMEELAFLQVSARYQLQTNLKENDLKNYHAFTSAMLYFTAMKRSEIFKEPKKDEYGALNLFYKYALKKINYIYKDDDKYYLNRIMNTIDGKETCSYISSLNSFIDSTVMPRFAGKDINDDKDKSTFALMITESNVKETFIESMSNYPLHQLMGHIKELNTLTNFDETKNEEIIDGFNKVNAKIKELGFTPTFDILEESKDLISNLTKIRELIDLNYEKLISFFRIVLVNLVNSITDISKKKIKTIKKSLEVASSFIALSSMMKYLEVITTKKIKELDSDNKEIEREINDQENKSIILKFLINLISKELTCGVYNRLHDSMEEVCDSIKNRDKRSIESYFTVSIGFMIVCADIFANIKDDGTNEDIVNKIEAEKIKLIGDDTVEMLVAGLKGKSDDGTTSRLNLAKNESIKDYIAIYNIVTTIAIDTLNEIVSYIK